MTKIVIPQESGNNNAENFKDNLLTVNELKEDFNNNQSKILSNLLKYNRQIIDAAAKDVIRRPALLSRYDTKNGDIVPIISQGTINIVQGKTGTHKSRVVELFCSLFLLNRATCNTDFLEFVAANFPVAVVYIDTERGVTDEFPVAVQRIREKAGFEKTFEVDNFYPVSIAKCERTERVDAVKSWLEYVQSQTSLPLFVVLDVVTDCVASFNSDKESLKLYDDLRNFADDCNATFVIVIHENPFSDKARGHTGTEGQNKASTIIQIGFNSDNEESDLLKIRFLKTRNIGKPNPIYVQYSKEVHGLVLADADLVRQQTEEKKKAFDVDLVKEHLESLLSEPKEVNAIYENLANEFKKQIQTVKYKVAEIIDEQYILRDAKGRDCIVTREKDTKDKRRVLLSLTPLSNEAQTEIAFTNVVK
jgi:DNA-binding MarR family transcriptional regulator